MPVSRAKDMPLFMTSSHGSWRLPFTILLLASVFCADTPQTHPFAVAIMGAALAWLVVQSFIARTVTPNLVSIGFGSLLLVLLISLPVALLNGTTFFDWALRGFAPLAFLFVFFLIRIRDQSDVNFVVGAILAATTLWCLLVCVDLAPDYKQLVSVRWTLLSSQLLLPFNLAGIALIVLGGRSFANRLLVPLLVILLVLTLGAGYRSHLALVLFFFAVAALLAVFGYVSARRLTLMSAVLVVLLPLPILLANLPSSAIDKGAEWSKQTSPSSMLSAALKNRGDVGRKLEFEYAVSQFLDAPVFGKGLSYRVPSELIFNGQAVELAQIEKEHGKKYPFVFYTHNSLGYLIMTTGLAGLGACALILAGLLRATWTAGTVVPRSERIASCVAIASLCAFSFISATYLLPQFNIVIGALCAIVAAGDSTRFAFFDRWAKPNAEADHFDHLAATERIGLLLDTGSRTMTALDQLCRYALLALAFLIPVGTLLPLHSYRLMEAIVFLVLLPVTLITRGQVAFPPLIRWSFWIGIAGWALSTVYSSAPAYSFDVGILEFLSFYVLFYLFLALLGKRHFIFVALAVFVCGVLVVSIYQTAIIFRAVHFPFPRSASDFIEYKKMIPLAFKDSVPNTYGNTDNYISLWTLLMPLLAGMFYVVRARWIVALSFVILAYCGLMVYSRIGLIVVTLAFLVLAAFRAYAFRKQSGALYLVVAVLVFIHLDAKSFGYMYGGATSIASVMTEESPKTSSDRATAAPSIDAPTARDTNERDASAVDRAIAWRYGMAIGTRHWLAGVGYGVYQRTEQIYTAPHNMALSRFAEGGILSLISFLLLAAYAPVNLARAVRQKHSMLTASCLVAVSAFMLKVILFGGSFAISSNFVWAFAVALIMAAPIASGADADAQS